MDEGEMFPVDQQPPADPLDPPSLPPSQVTASSDVQEVRISRSKRRRSSDRDQQNQVQDPDQRRWTSEDQQAVLIHGLSVERYRVVYSSVLKSSVLTALSSANNSDYVSQVLELKQRLWLELSRPQLVETVTEDGRVEVKEIFDLT
ncbi:uncharacterized protein AKAME5_002817800 [Lates japonicus]|uniref:Uncharacterized protein n=1 Tax=Lates japonicus TaxID=270547 RepID=A0AAD3R0W6_LATJO|nr:uncharacterized protein AKAME5_002817800 [Lates japonicus]